MRKNKVTLALNKPAYVGIFILGFSKVMMYEFHYDYIKNKYGNNSRLLFTDTDSWINEIETKELKNCGLKLKMLMKLLARIKKCFVLVIIQLSQSIMMIQTN